MENMENLKNKYIFSKMDVALFSIMFFFAGFCFTLTGYELFVTSKLRGEAVEKGYAEWKVINNSIGTTKFTWK